MNVSNRFAIIIDILLSILLLSSLFVLLIFLVLLVLFVLLIFLVLLVFFLFDLGPSSISGFACPCGFLYEQAYLCSLLLLLQ